jgi:hypothetical protein
MSESALVVSNTLSLDEGLSENGLYVEPRRNLPLLPAIVLTLTVSAFLLFQVQPIVAKGMLPWFGGVPAVWTVCMLCFQGLLLAGYAYAHALITYLSLRRQALVHSLLLLASLSILPTLPAAYGQAHESGDPTWAIAALLGSTVGVPYFLLASTAPLLQAWFSYGALGHRRIGYMRCQMPVRFSPSSRIPWWWNQR